MAIINTTQAGAALRLTAFGGIDRRGTIGDLENLRLSADGRLTRRCGYAHALTLGAAVRGVWSGSFLGEETVFAAAGTALYRLDLTQGTASAIGSIAAGEGRVALFLWRGRLCCIDGVGIYFWDGASFAAAEPYVPLIAREWAAVDLQNIYEPINLLTRRARFTFRTDGEVFFYFGVAVASIERIYNITESYTYLNTAYRLYTDAFGNSRINFNTAPDRDCILLVEATLDTQYDGFADIAACTDGVVFGGSYDDRMLCWGGGGASEMFCSQPVTEEQLADARLWGQTSGELYFPLDCNFHVGDGRYPLRAVCRHYDRLLIFTAGDAWEANFADSGSTRMPVTPVNAGIGCSAPNGAVQAGNDPLTVADGAIWRWKSGAQRRDECSAEPMTAGLPPFSADFSRRASVCSCRARSEVWFADPGAEGGVVYVYHTALDAWYRFGGIAADGLFACGNDVGFWRGSSFYRFDEARETDLDTDGERPIAVRLTLEGIDLGRPERLDRLTRLALHLEGSYPALTLTAETDLGRSSVCSLAAGGSPGTRTLCDRPLRTGRFRRLQLTLTASGGPRLQLCGLVLTAEPGARDRS